jgi:polyhydroxyalkanoate synthesis regulator phasin
MEQFFIRVLTAVVTSDAVRKMLSELMRNAADTVKGDIEEVIKSSILDVEHSIEDLEKNALGNLDAMDGKVGNLQEQLTNIPGQIIDGIISRLPNFGGLFGQR